MSKSKHNGVDPTDLVHKYGCDTVRFVFIHCLSRFCRVFFLKKSLISNLSRFHYFFLKLNLSKKSIILTLFFFLMPIYCRIFIFIFFSLDRFRIHLKFANIIATSFKFIFFMHLLWDGIKWIIDPGSTRKEVQLGKSIYNTFRFMPILG